MKICVIGAGAIGGLLGARLALAGEDVTLIDQGAHLEAIRKNGLTLIWHDGTEHVAKNIKATDSFDEAGKQELVILALKAHIIEKVAPQIPKLFDASTVLLPVQNGVPWWYFQRHGGQHDGRRLDTLDPNGTIAAHVDPKRIIGCVVYPAGEIVAPGVVKCSEGDRFPIGELDGQMTERAKRVSDTLVKAGLKSPILDNVRAEIWLKLWGNLSFNPISALAHATLVDICQFPPTRQLAADMMTEAQAIANKLGITFRLPLEKRIAGAEKVGKHKTSTLQDVEAGRPIEVEPLIGAVVELGRITETPTPHIDAVYALTSLLNKMIVDEHGSVQLRKAA
ncbi:MAG: 2-dehydropantoate 2-reductase [Betaproteobacteria bacterium RIFCSPLOWO2_12_FULL_62_13]|nr:MAG: 2-dehydropantoate 2-reductase [Betaproteobacteria bacterium RIFCSPLOWO2_12_FULL_62_13]